jgi:hypothetical protein
MDASMKAAGRCEVDLRRVSEIDATMTLVATLADRILDAIRCAPLDDDVLTRRLGVSHRQTVNHTARRLEAEGRLRRFTGRNGKIVNALPTSPAQPPLEANPPPAVPGGGGSRITEDEVKEAVRAYLRAEGFDVQVAWGRVRGIDLDARHPDGRRYVIEAKAEVGKSGPQQVNYFIGMLGELVQRMDDAHASYGIALPANGQYRGLVARLPALAKERLQLTVFWVSREDGKLVAEIDS